MAALREQQWIAAQKLLAVVQCFLENFGDEQLEKMTLSQATSALVVALKISRMAITGCGLPHQTEPALLPNETKSGYTPPTPSVAPAELLKESPYPIRNSQSAMEEPLVSDAPVGKSCENLFSAPESAKKCRSVSYSEASPAVLRQSSVPAPMLVVNSRTVVVSPLASYSSRATCRTKKTISGAGKCRKVPFGLKERCEPRQSFAEPCGLARPLQVRIDLASAPPFRKSRRDCEYLPSSESAADGRTLRRRRSVARSCAVMHTD